MERETHSLEETQKLGHEMAEQVLGQPAGKQATVFALQGELGAGKTSFAQGFAAGLGITENVLSPTFLIVKSYIVPDTRRTLYHIDCYRIKDSHDLLELDWQEIVHNPQNIILLEWPARVKDILPKTKTTITFELTTETGRRITIQS